MSHVVTITLSGGRKKDVRDRNSEPLRKQRKGKKQRGLRQQENRWFDQGQKGPIEERAALWACLPHPTSSRLNVLSTMS